MMELQARGIRVLSIRAARRSLSIWRALYYCPVLLAFAAPPLATAGEQSSSLVFNTTAQNLWGAGGELGPPSYDEFYGFGWDLAPIKIIDIGTATSGNTGFDLFISSAGKVGVQFNMDISGGSVSANLPYDAGFGFNRGDLDPGSTPLISTFANLGSDASFDTLSPQFQMFSDLIFKINAGIQGRGCIDLLVASTCGDFNETLLDVDEPVELFAINRDNDLRVRVLDGQPPTPDFPPSDFVDLSNADKPLVDGELTTVSAAAKLDLGGFGTFTLAPAVTLKAKVPNIDAQGVVTTGGASPSLSAAAEDKIAELNLDVDDLIGLIPGAPTLGIGGTFEDDSGAVVIGASADIADIDLTPSLTLEQSFTLTPTLMVSLDFNQDVVVSTDGGTNFFSLTDAATLDLAVGDDFNLQWDDSAPPLEITPTYSLTAMFGNKTALDIDIAASIEFFKAAFSLSVLGTEIADEEVGPVIGISCDAGVCEQKFFGSPIANSGFTVPDPAAIELLDLEFLLGGFQNVVGDVLILDGRDAVWLGVPGNESTGNWRSVDAWRDGTLGDDDRDVVLDLQNVRDAHNNPGLASTSVVISNGDTFTVDDLTISNGVTVDILNGGLLQGTSASRFDNQGIVDVHSVGDLHIGADVFGGGLIKILNGAVNVRTEVSGGTAKILDQAIEGNGDITFEQSVEFGKASTLTADGGTLRVVGSSMHNAHLEARDNATLNLDGSLGPDGYLSVYGGKLLSGPSNSKITADQLSVHANVVNNANLVVADVLRIDGAASGVDFTNNAAVSADHIHILNSPGGTEVGGVGTVTFLQGLGRISGETANPALTIGSGQTWRGNGTVGALDITNEGVFQRNGVGTLNLEVAAFDNDGLLLNFGGTSNLVSGSYDLRDGTIRVAGGTIVFGSAATTVLTDESPGGLWDARTGVIRLENAAVQWPGLKAGGTLDHTEVWLGVGGDIELDDPGVLGTQYVSIDQFIQHIGADAALRILGGRNYTASTLNPTEPSVAEVDVAGLLQLAGGRFDMDGLLGILNSTKLNILTDGQFIGFGRVAADDVINNGLVEVTAGQKLEFSGDIAGEGEYVIRDGGELEVEGGGFTSIRADNGTPALSGATVTVEAATSQTVFQINAKLSTLDSTTIKLLGPQSRFQIRKCVGLGGTNCGTVELEESLANFDDAHLELGDGRMFVAQNALVLNGTSSVRLDQSTYQSSLGMTLNDASSVALAGGSLDLGGVLTINSTIATPALSGTGVVRANVDSVGLIDVAGSVLRFEDSTIEQIRGGAIRVGERAGGGPNGILELSNVTVNHGSLAIGNGGIVVGSGDLVDVDIDVAGAILANQGDMLSVSGGALTNARVLRAQRGGELRLDNVVVNNLDGVIEIDAMNNPAAVDSVLSLAGATIAEGRLSLVSLPRGALLTDSAAVIRGYGDIMGASLTLDRFARIEGGAGLASQVLTLDMANATLSNFGTLTTADQGGTLRIANAEITGSGQIQARDGGRIELQNVNSRNTTISSIGDGVIVDVAQSTFANLTNNSDFEVRGHATFSNFLNNLNGAVSVVDQGVASVIDAAFLGGDLNVSDHGVANLVRANLSGVAMTVANPGQLNILDGTSRLSQSGLTGGTVKIFANGVADFVETSVADTSFLLEDGAQLNLFGGSTINTDALAVRAGVLRVAELAHLDVGTLLLDAGAIATLDTGMVTTVDLDVMGGSAVEIKQLAGLQATNIAIGAGASAMLDGGSINAAVLAVAPGGTFDFVAGTLQMTNADLVVGAGGQLGPAFELTALHQLDVTQNLIVAGGAALTLSADTVRASTIANAGDLQLAAFKVASGVGTIHNSGRMLGAARVGAALDNLVSGEVLPGTGGQLRFTGSGNTNAGRIDIDAGSVEFTGDLTNEVGGFVGGSGFLAVDGGLVNYGTVEFSASSDVFGDVQNMAGGRIIASGQTTLTLFDDVVHDGAEIRVDEDASVVFLGSLSGAGALTGGGAFFVEGDLRPGRSPGLLGFDGDLSFGSLNVLEIEIGGLTRATQYDAVDVSGTLTLGGTLNVVLFDLGGGLFAPQSGDAFDIFNAGMIAGSFSGISLPGLQAGLTWNLSHLATDGLVSVSAAPVPLPAGLWLFLPGVLLLARRRRAHDGLAR